jgi:hypothetical protein
VAVTAGARAILGLLLPTALVGCTETLRFPPPMTDIAGAAGSTEPDPYVEPPASDSTGGGLVSGAGGASGPGTGGGGGRAGGSAGATDAGLMGGAGMIGAGGMAVSGQGGMVGPAFPSAPWVQEGLGRYMDLRVRPIGMSERGDRVVTADGLLWIDGGAAPGTLVRTVDTPMGISADGSTVFGSRAVAPPCAEVASWTVSGIRTGPPGIALAASANGKVIVGTAMPTTCPFGMGPRAFVSSALQPMGVVLAALDGDDEGEGLAVSADGSTAIGFSSSSASHMGRLFSWTLAAGMIPLHDTKIRRPGFDVLTSADGSVVAATLIDDTGNDTAFVWTSGAGLKPLPKVATRGQSLAFGLSADGSVVLVLGTNAPAGPPTLATQDGLPFTWSAANGPEALVIPATFIGFELVLMTPDASLIVGNPAPNQGGPLVAWDAKRAPRFLFADAPSFLMRCRPFVTRVSADGKTFAGSCGSGGRNTGFVARLP